MAAALALLLTGAPGCRCEGERAPGPPPERSGPPEPAPVPPEEAPLATAAPLPEGPEVPAPLLRERPSEAECEAACDRVLTAETAPWLEGTPEDARPDVGQVLADVRARQRPLCVRRCLEELSRAVTECVRLTPDVAAAVDCLTRTGAVGPAENP